MKNRPSETTVCVCGDGGRDARQAGYRSIRAGLRFLMFKMDNKNGQIQTVSYKVKEEGLMRYFLTCIKCFLTALL